MAGTPRSAKVREALEARAKAMRRAGASMAEIERETGVPASTLYQWAARGGWRLCDLENTFVIPDAAGDPGPTDLSNTRAANGVGPGSAPGSDPGLAGITGEGDTLSNSFLSSGSSVPSVLAPGEASSPSLRAGGRPCDASGVGEIGSEPLGASRLGTPDPSGPQGEQPPGASGVHPRAARTRLDGGPGGQEKSGPGALPSPSCLPNPTPENLLTLAETAKAEAMRLYALGRAREAREHLLTAQRFVAAAGDEKQVREQAQAAAQAEADGEAVRAELEARLLKLLPLEAARYAKAVERGEVEEYLAQQHTCEAQKWRDWVWWDELHKARAQYPPHGFRELTHDGGDGGGEEDYAFLNAWLAIFAERPNWREALEQM